jgi:electron transfer flavoprotein beta subunit
MSGTPLVRALELKEAAGAGSVTTITVGGAETEPTIRKAWRSGPMKRCAWMCSPPKLCKWPNKWPRTPRTKGFDLILAGKETIDYNGGQVGAMVAELLDLPYVALASKLDLSRNDAAPPLPWNAMFPAVWKCWK